MQAIYFLLVAGGALCLLNIYAKNEDKNPRNHRGDDFEVQPCFRHYEVRELMLPPDYIGALKIFYDWQTLFAGALALIAALIGAAAAYHMGRIQIAAAERKDRSQTRCLAVAILPELLHLRVRHDRASKIINDEFPRAKREHWGAAGPSILGLGRASPNLIPKAPRLDCEPALISPQSHS